MVMHPYIAKHVADARIDDLRRAARAAPPRRASRPAVAGVVALVRRPFARAKRTLAPASGPCS